MARNKFDADEEIEQKVNPRIIFRLDGFILFVDAFIISNIIDKSISNQNGD